MILIFNADLPEQRRAIYDCIKENIIAAEKSCSLSSIGNDDTLIINISLDKRDTWANNIYQNSRYSQFSISQDGTIELFSKSYKIDAKFRKQHAKSLIDAINRINKYIESVK